MPEEEEGEYNVSTAQKLIYMPDQLGSVRDVLDGGTGNLVQSYDYTPYGAVARANGSTPTDYQYAGLFAHSASGLGLATNRAIDGVTGRWINRDPIRESGGINVYAYVGAKVLNYTDPIGLQHNFQVGPGVPGAPGGPLDPRRFNGPLTPWEKQQITKTYNNVRNGNTSGLNPHAYKNYPSDYTGAQLPNCPSGYTSYDVPNGLPGPRSSQRIYIPNVSNSPVFYYSNTHGYSFYKIYVLP